MEEIQYIAAGVLGRANSDREFVRVLAKGTESECLAVLEMMTIEEQDLYSQVFLQEIEIFADDAIQVTKQ